jgi:hypothetical protein
MFYIQCAITEDVDKRRNEIKFEHNFGSSCYFQITKVSTRVKHRVNFIFKGKGHPMKCLDMFGQDAGVQLQPIRNSALEGGKWSASRSGLFTLLKTQYRLNRWLDGASGPVWTTNISHPSSVFNPGPSGSWRGSKPTTPSLPPPQFCVLSKRQTSGWTGSLCFPFTI